MIVKFQIFRFRGPPPLTRSFETPTFPQRDTGTKNELWGPVFKFGQQLLVAFGLVIGLTVIGSDSAAAKAPTTIDVSHSFGITAEQADGRCQIIIDGAWDSSRTPGPTVTVQLFTAIDDGPLLRAGYLERVADEGTTQFEHWPAEGTSVRYEIRVTKGPKHIVAVGNSDLVSCVGTPSAGV